MLTALYLFADNDINWRHTAWVWDETTDDITVYMDGHTPHTVDYGPLIESQLTSRN